MTPSQFLMSWNESHKLMNSQNVIYGHLVETPEPYYQDYMRVKFLKFLYTEIYQMIIKKSIIINIKK